VLSDYEFFVVTPTRLSATEQATIRRDIRQIAQEFGYQNSLFHVDIAFHQRTRLPKLPQSIFTFELKANAQLLSGVDIQAEIPTVTCESILKKELNTILYRRLWALMLYLPPEFVTNAGHIESNLTETTISYLLARNLLDISTVLVPRQGVLLPTYSKRISWWQAQGLSTENQTLGPSFLADISQWHKERQTLHFSQLANVRLGLWTQYMESALHIVGLDTDAPHCSPSPFQERPLTRGQWLRFGQAASLIARKHGLKTATTWAKIPQKAIRATAHLLMHQSLSYYLQGQKRQSFALLLQSWQWFPKLIPEIMPTPPEADFPTTWLLARKHWQNYQKQYLRNLT
jgi:hypothetical protein